MTVIAAAIKGNFVSIAADSLISDYSTKLRQEYLDEIHKIIKINDSFVGFTGYCATSQVAEHLMLTEPEKFRLNGRFEIFTTLVRIHKALKEDYFVNTSGSNNHDPTEPNQLNMMIVNGQGIFSADDCRNVDKYTKFWAIGSGASFALGALECLYDYPEMTSEQLVIRAVQAACKFDLSCELPYLVKTLDYCPDQSEPNIPSRLDLKISEKSEEKHIEHKIEQINVDDNDKTKEGNFFKRLFSTSKD